MCKISKELNNTFAFYESVQTNKALSQFLKAYISALSQFLKACISGMPGIILLKLGYESVL